jgi:3-oxoacyl-[acyl-carrier protein] reductase
MRLESKTAIITGAGDGIGRATALLFAREGARILCTDIDDVSGVAVSDEACAAGGVALYQHVDVRNDGEIAAAVRTAEERFGRVDIVVANAGTVGGSAFAKRTEELSDDEWAGVIDVNLNGVFRCFRAAIPALRRAGGGALSATASIAALTGVAGQSAYSASKGGIVSFVRSLAYELLADEIRVNCVCPGGVRTGLTRDIGDRVVPPHVTTAGVGAPVVRHGEADEVASCHLFLASDDASLVTGHALVADAGSMLANRWLIPD